MSSQLDEKDLQADFEEFLRTPEAPVPGEVSDSILKFVHKRLNPSPWIVFAKILGTHIVVGTFSLSICDQFGLNPFHTSFSLKQYFMTFGNNPCMAFCGFLFIGLTMLACWTILSPKEILILRKNMYLQIFTLSALSLGVLVGAGANVALIVGLCWLAGAMTSGISLTLVLSRAM